ncbi:hypothetical protein SRHO_G00083910 [Serrasalmus rhombeus]
MNWADSQQHCREYYRDLSTITTEEDNELALKVITLEHARRIHLCQEGLGHRREALRPDKRILVLVKENKTWEEAYEYCRAQYTGLAFLSSETQLNLAKKETKETQTVSVWTGLCILAEEPLGSRWGAWSHWPHFQQNPTVVELKTPRWMSVSLTLLESMHTNPNFSNNHQQIKSNYKQRLIRVSDNV